MPKNFSASVLAIPNETVTPLVFSLHRDPAAGDGVDVPTGSLVLRSDDGAVYAKLPGGPTAWGRLGNLTEVLARIAFTGNAADLVAGTVPPSRLPGLTGDVVQAPGSDTTTIAAGVVTNEKLRDSRGLSVIGRAAADAGRPADIVAAADGDVLRRMNGALGFGPPPTDLYTGAIVNSSVIGGASSTNWNPFGGDARVTIVRAKTDPDSSRQSIKGIAGGTPGRCILVLNVGLNDIIFSTDRTGVTAGNFILAPAAPEIIMAPGSGRVFWYDGESQGWRLTERV